MSDLTTVVIWLAFALICYAIAEQKGKNKVVAVALGLLFGFFAVIGYLLAKGSKEYQLKKAEEKISKLKK